jgi:hypothetical protein
MELIKRKILLETLTSRVHDSTYGTITASTININLFLTQNMDNMGMFTDCEYIPSSATTATTLSDYFDNANGLITGYTNSKLTSVNTGKRDNKYITGVNMNNDEPYINYTGHTITPFDGVISLIGPTGYTFNADINDLLIGTTGQTAGILYNDYDNTTTFQYRSEGLNIQNISLSGLVKEEMYLNIISPPETENDIFIERGSVSVFDPHLRLSEIEGVEHLKSYGNGYYNLITT